jgi:hypothetical protein
MSGSTTASRESSAAGGEDDKLEPRWCRCWYIVLPTVVGYVLPRNDNMLTYVGGGAAKERNGFYNGQ